MADVVSAESPEQKGDVSTPLDDMKKELSDLKDQLDAQQKENRQLQSAKDREVAGVQSRLTQMESDNSSLTEQLLAMPGLDDETRTSFRMNQLEAANNRYKQQIESANRMAQTRKYWKDTLGVPDIVFVDAATPDEATQAATNWAKQKMEQPAAPAPDPARVVAQAAAQAGGLDVSMSPGQPPSGGDSIEQEYQRGLAEIKDPSFRGDKGRAFMELSRKRQLKETQASTS